MARQRYYHQYARDRRRREVWAARYAREKSAAPPPVWKVVPVIWGGTFLFLLMVSAPTGWAGYDFLRLTLWAVASIVGLIVLILVAVGIFRMTPEGKRQARWRKWAGPTAKPPRTRQPK